MAKKATKKTKMKRPKKASKIKTKKKREATMLI